MQVIGSAIALLAFMTLVPIIVLGAQICAAVFSRKVTNTVVVTPAQTSVCLLMPAHNESFGIAAVLQDLLPQLQANMRLLVVADNCTDDTADVVRQLIKGRLDVEVIERENKAEIGKGYALNFGINYLKSSPPQVLIIIDADCELEPGSIDSLASACIKQNRPIQALYLMRSPQGSKLSTRIAELAWLVKNYVRPLGGGVLGMPCQLMGSGMAFTWGQINTVDIGTGHIVEDMDLGIQLARTGTPALFHPQAVVSSLFPLAADGLRSQRTRWEHGHLSIIVHDVPKLIWQSAIRREYKALALGLDLAVPPLSLLFLLVALVLILASAFAWLSGDFTSLLVASVGAIFFYLSIFVAWLSFGRSIISTNQLVMVPAYILKKIPVYIYFLIRRQSHWIRSKRDGE